MQVQALARAGRWSLALLLFITSTAAAQVRISGGISGTVSDQSGGVVPGATVQLKDEGTGNPRETITNEQGYFAFPDLSFGTYQVTVTLQGFQTAVYNKVVVEASRTTDLRVSLQPGGLSEVVTVEGATPVLETSSNVISGTLRMVRSSLILRPRAATRGNCSMLSRRGTSRPVQRRESRGGRSLEPC